MRTNLIKSTVTPYEALERAKSFISTLPFEALERLGISVDPFNYDYITGYPLGMYIPSNGHIQDPFESVDASTLFTEPPSAYIHIPFCSGLCTFCYFTKYVSQRTNLEDDIGDYLSHVLQEIRLWKRRYDLKHIHSLYIGGGTASIMTERNIRFLFEEVIQREFEITPGMEITFEGHPQDMSETKLHLLKNMGVTRISIGTQSLKDSILRDTNRRHTAADTLRSLERVGRYFENYNVDFMYGFPSQTVEDILEDTQLAVAQGIPSLTFYRLEVHTDTAIWKTPKHLFPSAVDILTMKRAISELLVGSGYAQDNIDWFISDRRFAFSQQSYKWTNNYYVGFGLGSYGFFRNVTYGNVASFPEYYSAVDSGNLPISQHFTLSKDDLMRREAVFAMKISEGLDTERFRSRYGLLPQDYFRTEIEPLIRQGLLETSANRILLTELGRLFSDQVAERFYSEPIKQTITKYRHNVRRLVGMEMASIPT